MMKDEEGGVRCRLRRRMNHTKRAIKAKQMSVTRAMPAIRGAEMEECLEEVDKLDPRDCWSEPGLRKKQVKEEKLEGGGMK